MEGVKWVKLTVDMFDNRKIKYLRRLPEGNNIVLIWVMLLTLAGRCNSGGMIFLTENIPYSLDLLSAELGFEENTVKLALAALEELGMVQTSGFLENTSGGEIEVTGWSEHQNIDGMEKIRERDRLKKQRQRERKKMMQLEETAVSPGQSRDSHGDVPLLEEDKEIDIKNKNKREVREKPPRHEYGTYKNVLLSDSDIEKLKTEFPNDWQDRIERVSGYCQQSGKTYKDYLATIRNWARTDEDRKAQRQVKPNFIITAAEAANRPQMKVDMGSLTDFLGGMDSGK